LKQWAKHLLALTTVVLSLVVNFIRGSKSAPGRVKRCSDLDGAILVFFFVLMVSLSLLGVCINRREQALKVKVGRGLVPSDIRYRGSQLVYLLFFAFCGGWVSGAIGLGGSSIFNPLMISMGVPPLVATSTAMYMILYSSTASTVIYFTYGALDLPYAAWISLWCSLGVLIGASLFERIFKRYNRQSLIVFVLAAVLALSAIVVPYTNL
jgi:uncharacterized membrane protein YfcA